MRTMNDNKPAESGFIVRPFKGANYGNVKQLGLSFLILGESSFSRQAGKRGQPLPVHHNEEIIGSVSNREKDNTITRAVGVLYGNWRSWEQRWDFWQVAAFANYLQVDM